MHHLSPAALLCLGIQFFNVVILQTIPRPTADASVSELLSFPAKGLLDDKDTYQPIFNTCHNVSCNPHQFQIDTRVAGSVFRALTADTGQLVAHGANRRSGTTIYLAPEKFRATRYFNAVDWYSFGVMLYEMFTGHNPFRSIAKLVDIEVAAKRGLPRLKNRALNDFIQQIAHPNWELRWAQCNGHSDAIRNHPYLRDPPLELD
ncbi:AGC protein kinase, variant [Paramicrosporidium saccamoebae]|uniref:AGC protein kinase, variant n=1 Tax=Paramicrosporidium saccamoebae TaxID=1246581 RepID=A0A2H9TGC1_9FUNG|nr:AGC protein kinase, variant [Paramicrosporidium saccamoebae]